MADNTDFFADYPTYQNNQTSSVNPVDSDDDPFSGGFAQAPAEGIADSHKEGDFDVFSTMGVPRPGEDTSKAGDDARAEEGSFAFVMQGGIMDDSLGGSNASDGEGFAREESAASTVGLRRDAEELTKKETAPKMDPSQIGKPVLQPDGPPRPSTPPAVLNWKKEYTARIETRKMKEAKIRGEDQASSVKTLSSMQKKFIDRKTKNEDANKKEERETIQKRDAIIAQLSKPGDPPNWDVVPELCDLSGNHVKGQRDISRMRGVLLKLKTSS